MKKMRKMFNVAFAIAATVIAIALMAMPAEAATIEYGEGSEVYEALNEQENCHVTGWQKLDDEHTRYDMTGFDGEDYAIGWVVVENELDEYGDLVIVAGQFAYYDYTGRHDIVYHPDREEWVVYVGGLPTVEW